MADLVTAKSLREKELVPIAQRIYELRDKITSENRDFTAEEQQNWEKANADYEKLKKRLDILERAEQVGSEMAAPKRKGKDIPGRQDVDSRRDNPDNEPENTEETRALALQAWCRHQAGLEVKKKHRRAAKAIGINYRGRFYNATLVRNVPYDQLRWKLRSEKREERALSVTQITAGGAVIPEGFVQNLEEALLQFGGIRQVAEVIRTASGNDLPWPDLNDTSNKGAILSENTTVTSQDISFGQIVYHAFKYTSKLVLVPVELMEDSAFDLAAELGRLLGIRIGRIQSDHFTTGTGASQPTGIVTASTLGATGFSTTAIGGDDLYALKHSVDPAYRQGFQMVTYTTRQSTPDVGWMMNDQILLIIKKIKDGTGHYLWQSSMAGMGADMIDGDPYFINQSMVSSIGSGNKTVLYGKFSKYKIRDVAELRLRRLIERYADSDQVGFVAFTRADGNLLDAGTHPVKYLTH
jgi:HK97 family phage major capsid protein